MVNLPEGVKLKSPFFYERVHKRCYNCQHMTHEKANCPLLLKNKELEEIVRRVECTSKQILKKVVHKPSDPFYGVLEESQVDMYPILGRPKIGPEMLEGMRQYF